MVDLYCYSFVEDSPSAAVAQKLVTVRNALSESRLIFIDGFPAVMGGLNAIKERCGAFLNMAQASIYTFVITDLDTGECACTLIRDWFEIPTNEQVSLPNEVIFRVAVREVESWILADRAAWARHIGIPAANFTTDPDSLDDPKLYLLSIIQRKGRKRIHREMLPFGTAHIGPRYNEVLCDFVTDKWSPERAARKSPSLDRALKALLKV